MEPDVIRMYSSSPPPMEDAMEDDDDEFGDFGTFSSVPSSISFTEMDTPTTFNQTQALTATSPPELLGARGLMAGILSTNGARVSVGDLTKVNGVPPESLSDRRDVKKVLVHKQEVKVEDSAEVSNERSGEYAHVTPGIHNSEDAEVLTNGFGVQGSPSLLEAVQGPPAETQEDTDAVRRHKGRFADFAAFSEAEFAVSQTLDDGSESHADGRRTSKGSQPCWGPIEDQGPAGSALCPALALNGVETDDGNTIDDVDPSPSRSEGPGSETENGTETLFGRSLSTDALEELGDASMTGSAPSSLFLEDATAPTEHSQLAADDEEEDFGDFGDCGFFGTQGFGDLDRLDDCQEASTSLAAHDATEDDYFGDFNSPTFQVGEVGFASFPGSDSFGNFSSAASEQETDAGWSAFGEQQDMETWAAFSSEEMALPVGRTEVEQGHKEEWHVSDAGEESIRTDKQTVALCACWEKVFLNSFPAAPSAGEEPGTKPVQSLRSLLEHEHEQQQQQQQQRWVWRDVWTQLQDIHEAFGLRHQWGGSYCNKTLLCCLGIDTRNILFTGQKKQPVIVPMYAASLGMLEPTKEPVKPVSAAEMIASIAQTPATPEKNSVSVQEALPPVQFDWSSSGLTNPLDVSGGSYLLNLDFFGPVEDCGSSSSPSIPGVDPELFELTTAKLEPGSAGSRVADAFARLMSTMEKTSTSTRKPRRDENLSEEAAKVICSLPDLSFMTAKVLMFPTTLTPLDSVAD